MTHEQSSFFGPFLKNKVPMVLMVCQQPPTFFFQETDFFDSETHTMATYVVSSKGCSRWHQGQGVQKVCPTRTSSCTLHVREGSHARNGFRSKKWQESQDRGSRWKASCKMFFLGVGDLIFWSLWNTKKNRQTTNKERLISWHHVPMIANFQSLSSGAG